PAARPHPGTAASALRRSSRGSARPRTGPAAPPPPATRCSSTAAHPSAAASAPTSLGACWSPQVQPDQRRVHLPRPARVARQQLALPLLVAALGLEQPPARHRDRPRPFRRRQRALPRTVLVTASFRGALVGTGSQGRVQLLADDALQALPQIAPQRGAQRVGSQTDFTRLFVPDRFLHGVVLRYAGLPAGWLREAGRLRHFL